MNNNTIEYITHKIINGDVSLVPTKEWHHNVEADLRNTWLPRVGSFENVVTAISYKKDAIYCTLFRKVKTSRDGDFQFVCLHIPYFMILDLDTMVVALEKLKAYVKGCEIQMPEDSTVGSIVNEIKVINNNIVPPTSYMQGAGYAYRQVGGLFLYKYADIIKGQYQSEYNKYGVVFILDENETPVGIDKDADLTNNKIQNHIWFSKSDLVDLGDNVSVYCGDKPFDSPIRVESNGGISLTFKKKGFEDQKQNISVADGKVKKISWKYKVTKAVFDVRDEKNNPISSFDVYMVGDRKLPQELYETELNIEHNVKIKADGYDTLQTKVKFIPGEKTKPIIMKQKPIKCYISLKNGTNAELVFNTFHKEVIQLNGGPIWGYHATKENPFGGGDIYFRPNETLLKHIKKDNPSMAKKILKIFLPVILLLLMFCAGFGVGYELCSRTNASTPNVVVSEEKPKVENDNKGEVNISSKEEESLKLANDYLSEKQVWNRNEMEKIEPLKGVWDAMNMYDYKKLQDINEQYKFQAPIWTALITAINDGSAKKRDNTFCPENDYNITVASTVPTKKTYLDFIKSEVSTQATTPRESRDRTSSSRSTSNDRRQGSRGGETRGNDFDTQS